MPVAVPLLREGLGAEGAAEGPVVVVRPNVVLHVRQLAEHFQADFALHALVLAASLFVGHLHCAPKFTDLLDGIWLGFDGWHMIDNFCVCSIRIFNNLPNCSA